MFIHKKELLHPVIVTQPSPQFGQFLLEQFGGATGELTAGLQYFVQSQHTDDPNLRTCCSTSRPRNSVISRSSLT